MDEWILGYYNFDYELVKQKNFHQNYEEAMEFFMNNRKKERENGFYLDLFYGLVNKDYPIE